MGIARLHSRLAAAAATVLLALLAFAPAAGANVGEQIIERCLHGKSLSGFSQSAYSQALKEMTTESEEYSACSSLIRQAQLAAASGQGGGAAAATASSVALPATPSEQRAIARATHATPPPVEIGGQVIRPGVVHVDIASALSTLPTPLLASVAFLLACLLVFAGNALRNRVRARRSD